MELTLYVADEDGMLNLAGIVPPGTHYTAARNVATGVVRLTPVKVATTTPKTAEPAEPAEPDGGTAWDQAPQG